LFIGFRYGFLGIYNIKKNQIIKNYQIIKNKIEPFDNINSVAFTQDNLGAYISDYNGNIKLIKWKHDATTEKDFDFSRSSIQVGSDFTEKICLTKDDKNLLVGSDEYLRVFNTLTRFVTKKFKLNDYVMGLN